MKLNVLSLFDGISCGQIALSRAGFQVDNYFASEIDKYAIKVTQHNYPNTIQLGDVTKWKSWNLPKIDLLIGGSPCQGFSRAGNKLNFEDPRSKLFFEYVKILKKLKKQNPKIKFLLENVNMKKEWQEIISKYLKTKPIKINSSLVSAQHRVRLYWTNIDGITQPEDKNIFLKDILEKSVDEKYFLSEKQFSYVTNNKRLQKKFTSINGIKSLSLMAGYDRLQGTHIIDANGRFEEINFSKSGTLQSRYYKGMENFWTNSFLLTFDKDKCRKLTPLECERLQTVPDNYTAIVSNSQRYKMLGNGWTVDVIVHILQNVDKTNLS